MHSSRSFIKYLERYIISASDDTTRDVVSVRFRSEQCRTYREYCPNINELLDIIWVSVILQCFESERQYAAAALLVVSLASRVGRLFRELLLFCLLSACPISTVSFLVSFLNIQSRSRKRDDERSQSSKVLSRSSSRPRDYDHNIGALHEARDLWSCEAVLRQNEIQISGYVRSKKTGTRAKNLNVFSGVSVQWYVDTREYSLITAFHTSLERDLHKWVFFLERQLPYVIQYSKSVAPPSSDLQTSNSFVLFLSRLPVLIRSSRGDSSMESRPGRSDPPNSDLDWVVAVNVVFIDSVKRPRLGEGGWRNGELVRWRICGLIVLVKLIELVDLDELVSWSNWSSWSNRSNRSNWPARQASPWIDEFVKLTHWSNLSSR